jgi:glycine/D-amino acid oxidase-like deaminating enzyme
MATVAGDADQQALAAPGPRTPAMDAPPIQPTSPPTAPATAIGCMGWVQGGGTGWAVAEMLASGLNLGEARPCRSRWSARWAWMAELFSFGRGHGVFLTGTSPPTSAPC